MIPIRDTPSGATFQVKVHPRAKKNAITGVVGDALKLALTAPPVEGRANEACIAFLAEVLNVPRSSVTIAAGESSRNKVIRVSGLCRRRSSCDKPQDKLRGRPRQPPRRGKQFEFCPALARHPHRLRASLLGRQPQRVVRAAFLLRGLRFAGALPPRSAAFPHRADRHAHRDSLAGWYGFCRCSAEPSPTAWASAVRCRSPT